ncbi:hypothetical protein AT864_01756 [Anoxybacillus sp. P3H1B]|nr:hypothetical protein AT864_01756 [Anoxybacillus sp. P3H1B]
MHEHVPWNAGFLFKEWRHFCNKCRRIVYKGCLHSVNDVNRFIWQEEGSCGEEWNRAVGGQ